jgi:hypothetical protein
MNRFPGYPRIQRNLMGAVVEAFQRGLNIVINSGFEIDGEFSPDTQAACEHFQKDVPDPGERRLQSADLGEPGHRTRQAEEVRPARAPWRFLSKMWG